MNVRDDETVFKRYVGRVYFDMEKGVPLETAKLRYPFPELSDDDRSAVYAEAERHIAEVKAYLRKEANQWFWWGAGILIATFAVMAITGGPEAPRQVGRMWLGFLISFGCFGYGIFCKIWPLR